MGNKRNLFKRGRNKMQGKYTRGVAVEGGGGRGGCGALNFTLSKRCFDHCVKNIHFKGQRINNHFVRKVIFKGVTNFL
jgi:hypothetical protein